MWEDVRTSRNTHGPLPMWRLYAYAVRTEYTQFNLLFTTAAPHANALVEHNGFVKFKIDTEGRRLAILRVPTTARDAQTSSVRALTKQSFKVACGNAMKRLKVAHRTATYDLPAPVMEGDMLVFDLTGVPIAE